MSCICLARSHLSGPTSTSSFRLVAGSGRTARLRFSARHGRHLRHEPLGAPAASHLQAAGVPSVLVEFPNSDHAFDLVLPHISPAAQAATYDVERFLALMV